MCRKLSWCIINAQFCNFSSPCGIKSRTVSMILHLMQKSCSRLHLFFFLFPDVQDHKKLVGGLFAITVAVIVVIIVVSATAKD